MDPALFEVTCKCGHTYETDRKKSWCVKCGNWVFTNPKDRRNAVVNKYYFTIIGLLITVLLSVAFIEFIMVPILKLTSW